MNTLRQRKKIYAFWRKLTSDFEGASKFFKGLPQRWLTLNTKKFFPILPLEKFT
jgi:hypothetical protein